MKTRIEIKRSYDRINKVRIENPILVKEPGKPDYFTSGAVLHGPSQVFYKPDEHPRTYIEVEGDVSPVERPVDDPKENRTGRITYVNILLMTIDGNRGNKIPERRNHPCPCLLKRTSGRTEYGHHIKIGGPAKILSSLRKPIRKNVFVWIEAPSDSVECIKTGECFCTLRSSPLAEVLSAPTRAPRLNDRSGYVRSRRSGRRQRHNETDPIFVREAAAAITRVMRIGVLQRAKGSL